MKKIAKKVPVETRHTEERFTTTNPAEMLGKYLAKELRKSWEEDFLDEDTGDVVSIGRHEPLIRAGQLIDQDLLAEIMFHQQAQDITDVEVSNQCRVAYLTAHNYLSPWSVTALIGSKKRKFLLYATSAHNALEIATDYIELNFTDGFHFVQVKAFDWCIFLPKPQTDEPEPEDMEFYKIEVEVVFDNDIQECHTFVFQTKDVDTGVVAINDYLLLKFKEDREKNGGDEPVDFKTVVKSGTTISCDRIVEKEFSEAYLTPSK
jgi:hypothetical protein